MSNRTPIDFMLDGVQWKMCEGGSTSSKSPARKAASAQIAKIPLVLARHIAAVYK